MNDRQAHLEHFERSGHRVCEKPFAPGTITRGEDIDRMSGLDEPLSPVEALFLWAGIIAFCVGLIGLVAAGIGWLSVVL